MDGVTSAFNFIKFNIQFEMIQTLNWIFKQIYVVTQLTNDAQNNCMKECILIESSGIFLSATVTGDDEKDVQPSSFN